MRILITGSSGLIGSEVVRTLAADGHQLISLVRRPARNDRERQWNPEIPSNAAVFDGADAVVHLAGENVAGIWTPQKKRWIRESRVKGTSWIAESIAGAVNRPKTLISASAIGIYGSREDEILTEESGSGSGFLASVCRDWEAATRPAREAGVRVVNVRIGIVLSSAGGALKKMLPPFRLGAGGKIGSGRQWWSWIAIQDVAGAIRFALSNSQLSGPVNLVAPRPVTNADFTGELGRALHRPTVVPVPSSVVKLVFGEMGRETMLASARVKPAQLLASGYPFRFATLSAALEAELAK